jgi:hypothetical protein
MEKPIKLLPSSTYVRHIFRNPTCGICTSSMFPRWPWQKELGCIHEKCENYYKKSLQYKKT